jgi:hypothetical protein
VEAISGSNTTLTYPLQGSSFQWQRWVNPNWSTLQQGAKYGNVNTSSPIIYNVDPGDEGQYLCRGGSRKYPFANNSQLFNYIRLHDISKTNILKTFC